MNGNRDADWYDCYAVATFCRLNGTLENGGREIHLFSITVPSKASVSKQSVCFNTKVPASFRLRLNIAGLTSNLQ